jgi:hypothetical protein
LAVTGFALGEQALEQLANALSLKWINISVRSWAALDQLSARRPETTVLGTLLDVQPTPGRDLTSGGGHEYGMFTDDGNVAVNRMVTDLASAVDAGEITDRHAFDERLEAAMDDIDESGHHEVTDTDVREQIARALRPVLQRAGIEAEDITAT